LMNVSRLLVCQWLSPAVLIVTIIVQMTDSPGAI
jgi:hypothetical protein